MEFANPILPGMHPDPTICKVGRKFYLACSSCEYFPGVPIYESRDLVTWRLVGHALHRRSQIDLRHARSSAGIYAPTLRYHDGTYFLVTTLAGRGNFVVTARNPRGPWSDPCWLDEDGIDPSLAFLDGGIYYTRNGHGTDFDHPFIYQGELARDGDELRFTRKPHVIWKGTGGVWPEAPHLYRRGDWYYLVTAEGGTSYGHSVVAARSTKPHGPFSQSPHGPVITHRDRPRHPIQATGHADLVELDDGSTWAVLLGIRPGARGHHHLGRETFLAPVWWDEDGWPHMPPLELRMEGPPMTRSRVDVPPARVKFGRTLGPTWIFVRNPIRGSVSLRERPGYLRLWGSSAGLSDIASPTLVCRRQQHLDMTARTRLSFNPRRTNEQAGICIRANEQFHLALLVGRGGDGGRELRLDRTLNGRTTTLGRLKLGRGPVTLEVRATAKAYTFRGNTGETLHELGHVQTNAISAETILARTGRHHFTGAVFGLVATGGGHHATMPADFHWFEYAA
jgi:xylan 1,4-beta-xylosidase